MLYCRVETAVEKGELRWNVAILAWKENICSSVIMDEDL